MSQRESDKGIVLDGVSIAPGVVETIISLAAAEVDGVAGVGTAGTFTSIAAAFNSGKSIPTAGVKVEVAEDNKLSVAITIQAYYGHRLVDVAANVRKAVADALKGQIGADVTAVDIAIDSLSFEE